MLFLSASALISLSAYWQILACKTAKFRQLLNPFVAAVCWHADIGISSKIQPGC